uniref:M20_dimer domain-containing protein n=1 Tax=Angiostrongylus cantonensis TaxID=6313 RepID=A0A0K0DMW4_ANGCA
MPDEDIAVTKFREYLRINTEQPSPDYDSCRKFLIRLADELGIQSKVVEAVAGKPFVIMTIPGLKPDLSSIVLYSHTDVVPTFKDKWMHDPYSAHKDEQGRIYARGAQDMKCVGSQYFEAIRRHFLRGKKQWLRTIHIVWGPGVDGMKKFVQMPEFRELNLGFMLDEGLASETSTYKVYYGERNPWWVEITCSGSPGHGSKFIENTAVEKLVHV